MGVVFSFLTAPWCSSSTYNGCGWIRKVILYFPSLELDLVLFSLAEYKSENYNLLQYQQFKMFCLDPVLAMGYQHSSLSCFCWLQVYNPQFHSLNLSLRRHFTTQGCGVFFTLEKKMWSVPLVDLLPFLWYYLCSYLVFLCLNSSLLNHLMVDFLNLKGSSFRITWIFSAAETLAPWIPEIS